jgi:hypothetical protein
MLPAVLQSQQKMLEYQKWIHGQSQKRKIPSPKKTEKNCMQDDSNQFSFTSQSLHECVNARDDKFYFFETSQFFFKNDENF